MVSCEHLALNMPELRSSLKVIEGGYDAFMSQFDTEALMDMDVNDAMPIMRQINRFHKRAANLRLAAVASASSATGLPGKDFPGRHV